MSGFRKSCTVGAAVAAACALALVAGLPAGAATPATRPAPTVGHRYGYGAVAMLGPSGRAASAVGRDSLTNLMYGGGTTVADGTGTVTVGVTTGREQVYLVFWGSQWGTESTDGKGYDTFKGDPDGVAPDLQAFFDGVGTDGETWSGVMTQYCEGAATGSQDCAPGDPPVSYPSGGALAGVWEDSSAKEPATASEHRLAVEAEAAATHFGNTTENSNRDTQYVIVSPTGTHPDGFGTTGDFCAWHDYSGDSGLTGGGASGPAIAFTNLPYIPDAQASCGEDFVNSGNAGTLDGVTIVEGHEYAETITDQFPAGGWLASDGEESADKCAWIDPGTTGGAVDLALATGSFPVQGIWANDDSGGTGGCETSHPIASGVPTAPGTPAISAGSTSVAGDGQVGVSYSAATTNPSFPISGYTVVPSPACAGCHGLTTTGTSTTVSGLTPGVQYTFAVYATNSNGTGPTSSESGAVATTTVPGPPRSLAALVEPSADVLVNWSAPAMPSGLPVTYEISTNPACGSCQVAVHGTQATVSGAPRGSQIAFTVEAANSDGISSAVSSTQVLVQLGTGYWLVTASGQVFATGQAVSKGGVAAPASSPAVGIVATPDGRGYLVVTSDGTVAAFGDATPHGDLPDQGVVVNDIVAVAPTGDGGGYWLIGGDGGLFAFGDARYHGSLPGIGVHVSDVVGMVASPSGAGYLLVGADGGVFAFGAAHYYGSLPGLGVSVHDMVGILPSATGTGYVLVGADGGAFVFGTGVRYYGSLPQRGVVVHDIVGLALTPDDAGYLMAGADGNVYGFGDATVYPAPAGLGSAGRVAAIAGI